jgi:predicted CXXCH cytochrome family protein
MSCHDDGVAGTLPASGSDQTQTSPFTGSGAPPVIDETSWATSGHNGPVTCVGDGVTGCHASGHGSESSKLLANWNGGVGDPANNTSAAQLNVALTPRTFCMNCHDGSVADNATGGTGVTIETQFGPQTNTAYQITGSDYGPVNQQHDVFAADQAFSGQTETNFSCKDCHQPHANGASVKNSSGIILNSVANPDTGDPLPLYNPANYGGGRNSVDPQGTGWQETDTIEFCLACHDGTMPNGITMPTGMIDMVASWAGDQHGTYSNLGTTKGWLKYPYTNAPAIPAPAADYDGTTPFSAMTCTTCHGAHGSENIFNLKSSITVAGVQMTIGTSHGVWDAVAGQTEYVFPVDSRSGLPEQVGWGAWCSFCHDVNHDTKTGLGCQGSHMHGGGTNGNF